MNRYFCYAQYSMIFIVILATVFEAQQLYCYEANLTNTPIKCYTKTLACGIVSDVSLALVTVLIPLLLMIIFGLMTISNVHQVQSRLHPMSITTDSHVAHNTTAVNARQKKTDRQLLIMLFVQILVILPLTLPIALSKFYTTITSHTPKSALRSSIESFLFNFFLLLANLTSGMPFYIYALTGGTVFRKAMFSLTKTLPRKIKCQRGRFL